MKTKLPLLFFITFLLLSNTSSYGNICIAKRIYKEKIKGKSTFVVGPSLIVTGNLVPLVNGDTTPSNIDNTLFLSTQIAGQVRVNNFTIVNDGTSDLILSSIQITGVNASNFTTPIVLNSIVSAGTSFVFPVIFDPSSVGMLNASVEITSNDVNNPFFTFSIAGKGLNYNECGYNNSQEIVFLQNFETSSSYPVWNFSVASGVANVLAGSAFAENGLPVPLVNKFIDGNSLQIKNSNSIIAFNPINTLNIKDASLSIKLGSFAASTSEGSENSDYVTVAISNNGGNTYSNEIEVTGSSQAKWSFNSGVALAESTYSGTDISVSFSPSGSGFRTSDGYGTIILNGLPQTADLRVRLTVVNNQSNEIWAIDNVTLLGKKVATTIWDGATWSLGAPDSSKEAIVDGDYDSASNGDINACRVQVMSGRTVVIQNGNYLSSESDINNGGTINIQSGGSLLQKDDYATNVGSVSVKRDSQPMNRYDFTYWSSPVANQNLHDFSPDTLFDKYFDFNSLGGDWNLIANGAATMSLGKGFIVRAPQNFDISALAVFSGVFYGPVNNGIITTPVQLQSGLSEGWNLIGNPYPSALQIDSFLSLPENQSLVEGTVYLWTHNTPVSNPSPNATIFYYNPDDYATYNFTGGVATSAAPSSLSGGFNSNIPTGNIASGQSFFIKSISNGSVVFNDSMRLMGSNNNFFKNNTAHSVQTPLEKHRVWLDMKNDLGVFKQTLVGYIQTATNNLDSKFDGVTFNGNSYLDFYSINNNSKLTIQGRALPFNDQDQVPLGYSTTLSGSYTIRIGQLDGLFTGQNIYLKDLLLGEIKDLKTGDYTFTTDAGTFDSRFVLVYSNAKLVPQGSIPSPDALVLVTQKDKIIVNSSETIQSIMVNDILGKAVFRKDEVNQTYFEINAILPSNQVLLVTMINSKGEKIIRKTLF